MYEEGLRAVRDSPRVERRAWNSEAGSGPKWEQCEDILLVDSRGRDG